MITLPHQTSLLASAAGQGQTLKSGLCYVGDLEAQAHLVK